MTNNDRSLPENGQPTSHHRYSTHDLILFIAQNAIVAAIYFALTAFTQPISFSAIQVRFAEALGLLCFWRPDFVIGMTLGCFLANFLSPTPWDLLFGTMATLISCVLMSYASRWLWMAAMWPCVINGFVVGAEITWLMISPVGTMTDFWLNSVSVAVGELIALACGYVLWVILDHLPFFPKVFQPTRHVARKW